MPTFGCVLSRNCIPPMQCQKRKVTGNELLLYGMLVLISTGRFIDVLGDAFRFFPFFRLFGTPEIP